MFKIGENKLIRQFLLRSLTNKSKLKEIEKALISDSAFARQAMLAEDDLIEDYIDGDLSLAEEKLFVKNFLVSPERRENFEFLRLLITYVRRVKQNC